MELDLDGRGLIFGPVSFFGQGLSFGLSFLSSFGDGQAGSFGFDGPAFGDGDLQFLSFGDGALSFSLHCLHLSQRFSLDGFGHFGPSLGGHLSFGEGDLSFGLLSHGFSFGGGEQGRLGGGHGFVGRGGQVCLGGGHVGFGGGDGHLGFGGGDGHLTGGGHDGLGGGQDGLFSFGGQHGFSLLSLALSSDFLLAHDVGRATGAAGGGGHG
jgi:hypothetical protein